MKNELGFKVTDQRVINYIQQVVLDLMCLSSC